MKTPDEIKKGLECCAASYADCHKECPYKLDCDGSQILKDALALIQQLEADKQQLEGMLTHMNQLRDAAAGRALKMEERVHQLEAELEDMTARYKIADDCAKKKGEMNEKLYAELTAVKAERDAALADFKLYRERNIKGECGVYACDLCKVGGKYEEWEELKCPEGCMGIEHWQWRGVQKEE